LVLIPLESEIQQLISIDGHIWEGTMRHLMNHIRAVIILCLLLALAACNFPLASSPAAETETPTEAVTETSAETVAAAEEPVSLEAPEAGEMMLWTDSSIVVFVPAEEFSMGQDETEPSDHSPAHTVNLDSFWIYQAEVTNAQYANCVALGECSAPNTNQNEWYTDAEFVNAPVTGVTYSQAQTYCEWVEARLPTEAEWELAARGTDGATYPWGEDDPTCDLLNYEDCWDPNQPEVVRSYVEGASPYDLADTAGNAAEWVFDWYAEDYYETSPSASPVGPDTGEERVVRGSSFLTPEDELQIYLRNSIDPLESRPDLGFRCVLTGEVAAQPVLPMCQVISYSPSWHDIDPWPVQDIPAPGYSAEAYCNLDQNQNQYGTMSIWLDPGVNAGDVMVDSPNGNIGCTQDNVNFQLYNCWGDAIMPGFNTTVRVCPLAHPLQTFYTPVCPILYDLDQTTQMCVYVGSHQLMMCAAPNVSVPGYGCMPAPDALGQCPVGYYHAAYEGSPVCIPASGPHVCQPGEYCAAVCPEGLTFNEDSLCCEPPGDVEPICPMGYSMDASLHLCMPDEPAHAWCDVQTVPVPTCAVTVSTPPPTTGCLVYNVSGAIECQAPCPNPIDNLGPCTP
jgi:formylglycine-generating enzyme required for sulfatase activity